jgi:glutathionylspermidine synthase
MRRRIINPRPNWQATVESQGFHYHTLDDVPYWDESVCYGFHPDEIDELERATYALNDMCLKAVEHVITHKRLESFGVPPLFHAWIKQSWERDEHTIVGRFDLAHRPGRTPLLLEYNADTPTALLEAAVIQWHWLQDTQLGNDQFNSIHERLIEIWQQLSQKLTSTVYFSAVRDSLEDFMTVNYLRDTAMQAGVATEFIAVEDVGWNPDQLQFVDHNDRSIETIFKLYPWEWMLGEEFGQHLPLSRTRWFEPPWKMILSSKSILAVLWELFPDSPYLLRASLEPFGATHVRKPLRSREGANVTIVEMGQTTRETDGPYEGPYVYQELCKLAQHDGNYAVIGSWMVNGYACGIGVREDHDPITTNTSRFVPHYIE